MLEVHALPGASRKELLVGQLIQLIVGESEVGEIQQVDCGELLERVARESVLLEMVSIEPPASDRRASECVGQGCCLAGAVWLLAHTAAACRQAEVGTHSATTTHAPSATQPLLASLGEAPSLRSSLSQHWSAAGSCASSIPNAIFSRGYAEGQQYTPCHASLHGSPSPQPVWFSQSSPPVASKKRMSAAVMPEGGGEVGGSGGGGGDGQRS